MNKQFFSVLLEDRNLGGHYLVVAAGSSPQTAQDEAKEYFEQTLDCKLPRILGTFAGILQPLTAPAADFPMFSKDNELWLTPSARKLDKALADDQMIDYWTPMGEDSYVAAVTPPEELEKTHSPETVTLTFEHGAWWLGSSDTTGQGEFVLLSDAVAEANKVIEKIEAEFKQALPQ